MDSLTLPVDLRSVGQARRFVAERAAGHVEDIDGIRLMTSELVTNVVRHARTDVTVRVDPGPPFRVEVCDGVAATDAFRAIIAKRRPLVAVSSVGGRGIRLIHSLATRFGLDGDPAGGKVVWFEL